MTITLLDELTELRREYDARQQRYPYMLRLGHLSQAEADWRQACVATTIARLEARLRQQHSAEDPDHAPG